MTQTNVAQIADFFTSKGLSPTAVAGILGNTEVESNFDPTASNPNEGAIGIAQWEGGRRTALDQYAASVGQPETSLSAQLGYYWQELTGRGLVAPLNAATTPQEAAQIVQSQFEGSSTASLPQRQSDAAAFYPQITGGTLATAQAVYGATGQDSIWGIPGTPSISDIEKDILKPFLNFALNALFTVTGLGLVVLGVWKMTSGARADVKQTIDKAEQAAPLAAAVA